METLKLNLCGHVGGPGGDADGGLLSSSSEADKSSKLNYKKCCL